MRSIFAALAAALRGQRAGVASTATIAQISHVTGTGGNLAGRYLVANDDTAAIAATYTFVNITGSTGALHQSDFPFA